MIEIRNILTIGGPWQPQPFKSAVDEDEISDALDSHIFDGMFFGSCFPKHIVRENRLIERHQGAHALRCRNCGLILVLREPWIEEWMREDHRPLAQGTSKGWRIDARPLTCEEAQMWDQSPLWQNAPLRTIDEIIALHQGRMNELSLEEIDESISLMQRRLEQGQGQMSSAMCRLSLPMTLKLRELLKERP